MPLRMIKSGRTLNVLLSGEIDHHSAADIREAIDDEINRSKPETVRLDFSAVSFMDSSGVGLVMGRYRAVSEYGGHIEILSMPTGILKVMKLSGIERIAKIVN